MPPKEFVKMVQKHLIDENMGIYKKIFHETSLDDASDDYWKNALTLFRKLDDDDRDIFFRVMRQVSVDTMSSFFSIVDGTSYLGEEISEVTLNENKQKISGDLQDLFLEAEESP